MDWTTLEQNLRARTPGLMDATGKYAVLVPLVEGEEGPALLYDCLLYTSDAADE